MKRDESSYIVEKIKNLSSVVSREYFQMAMSISHSGEFVEEYTGWTESWMKERIRDIYCLIQAYIEIKGLPILLQSFKSQFENIVQSENEILKAECLHPEEEDELLILHGFRKFLNVFPDFDFETDTIIESNRLANILKQTRHILKQTNTKPNNEPKVYNTIKWILQLYYPSVRKKNRARFIGKFNTYCPDILIPEIKTAIEYKYIRMSANPETFINQLKTDSDNYIGDNEYEHFIAVIYLEDSIITTSDAIEVAWKSKKFPKNWKLVVAEGDRIVQS